MTCFLKEQKAWADHEQLDLLDKIDYTISPFPLILGLSAYRWSWRLDYH